MFGLKREEVTGGWRKLLGEEFHICAPRLMLLVIKSRRVTWAGHVARMMEM
jgi:hypothetical protein